MERVPIPTFGHRFLTILIIYGVSGTFFFPMGAYYLLKKLAHTLGGWVGIAVSSAIALAYFVTSYRGRPERRTGRMLLWLNKWWTISHWWFPISLRVWNGTDCSEDPSPAHKAALPSKFILAMHPHGPFPLSASVIMPQLAKFGAPLGDLFASVRFAAATAVFVIPFVRDMYLWLGCIEAGRSTLTLALNRGHSVAILPGGEDEQLIVCHDDDIYEDLVLPRDGLFRLALECETPLIPCFSFGERRTYQASSFMLGWRLHLVKKYRVGIPVAWGSHWWFPFVPRRLPVQIVIGKPIPLRLNGKGSERGTATHAEIDALRDRYQKSIESLFEEHKGVDEVAKKKMVRWVSRPTSKLTKEK